MPRSISIVEYKVQQAHFFLQHMERVEVEMFALQCFTDAFASACRSVTFALQAVATEVDGFGEYWAAKQKILASDPLAKFFNAYRVASTHIGDTAVRAGASATRKGGRLQVKYFFMPIEGVESVPPGDVISVSATHFKNLLSVTFDVFDTFKLQLDDQWYLTEANFQRMGKSLGDALQELGFPKGWLTAGGVLSEADAWRILRKTQAVGCQLNQLFEKYLGKRIAGPDEG